MINVKFVIGKLNIHNWEKEYRQKLGDLEVASALSMFDGLLGSLDKVFFVLIPVVVTECDSFPFGVVGGTMRCFIASVSDCTFCWMLRLVSRVVSSSYVLYIRD